MSPAPPTSAHLVLYRDANGRVPFVEWFASLPSRARAKVFARLEQLESGRHNLRPKQNVLLTGGLYELRVRHAGVTYSMLHFRFGLCSVVVVDSFVTPGCLRSDEVRKALEHKQHFEAAPERHRFVQEESP